ncbi:hypothetical protein Tco_0213459 [Tanacetum coccineum]
MQEVLNEFEHLKVWELIPRLDRVMIITLKWIYKISQSPKGIFLNQSKYALEIIKKYGMETSDPVDTPMVEKSKLHADPQGKEVDPTRYRRMISSLMYLTASRPDLQFTLLQMLTTLVSKIPEEVHLEVCSYWDRSLSWSSKKQKSTVISSTKIHLYCDNKSAIALCCNNVQHSRSKNIDIKYHFIEDQVENGVVELYFVKTEYQLAGIFTKALEQERLDFLINKLGMRSMSPEMLKSLADEEDE